jgi:cellulose synthase/poly-beta-1,6-N-acetylglucosamine synthase-like glycosyltransferase
MPVPSHVLVSTLTPVLNEERFIRETVAALQAQDVAGEAEFLFMDGRSTDGTRKLLEELREREPRIRVLDNPARHTASGLNVGLRAARGEYVARIDAHTRYPSHYLSRGIERLRRGDVQWVSGPQVPVPAGGWSGDVALALTTRLATGGSNRWDSDVAQHGGGEVELATGVFTGIWRRATLDRLGGWDENWPINQDSEMAARVLADGGRIVSLPELGAEYAPRDSLRKLARQYLRYGMYRAKTSLRHPRTVRPAHVAIPGLVSAGAAALVAPPLLRRPARAVLGAYGVALLAQTAQLASTRGRAALRVPAVLVTMHACWGAGYLIGLVRFAAPASRRPALATDLAEQARDDA